MEVDADGRILRSLPATTDRPQRPEGPIGPEAVLEHIVSRVYSLAAQRIARDLGDALAGGAIYRVEWRPRSSPTTRPAFLLANDDGFFLLQCDPHGAEFIGRDQAAAPDDDFEEADAEWDDWETPIPSPPSPRLDPGESISDGEAIS
jgi:hypothetical protein